MTQPTPDGCDAAHWTQWVQHEQRVMELIAQAPHAGPADGETVLSMRSGARCSRIPARRGRRGKAVAGHDGGGTGRYR